MQKIVGILLLVVCLCTTMPASASDLVGGSIHWKCFSDGKYQFYLTLFKSCNGKAFTYGKDTLKVIGAPLPIDTGGNVLSYIAMKADSVKWLAQNQGYRSPQCSDVYGSQLSCANREPGTLQEYYFISDTLNFYGTVPRNGWKFYWEACCRTPHYNNVDTNHLEYNDTLVIRAVMYPLRSRGASIEDCIDSSPEFMATPPATLCRGQESVFSLGVIDEELDSISYAFSYAFRPSILGPNFLNYSKGFTYDSPTPNKSMDQRNRAATIDVRTALMKLAVHNDSGPSTYLGVIRSWSWRGGVPIAGVYKEFPITVVDCPALPNGRMNKPPSFSINGRLFEDTLIAIKAGEKIVLPIEIVDHDSNGLGNEEQLLRLNMTALSQSQNLIDSADCAIPPCVFLEEVNAVYDSSYHRYLAVDSGKITANLIWQTTCEHLKDSLSASYQIHLGVTDDHCPVPSSVHRTISVRIMDAAAMPSATMNCLSKDRKMTWDNTGVNPFEFNAWVLFGSIYKDYNYVPIDTINDFNQTHYTHHLKFNYYYVQALYNSCDSVGTSLRSNIMALDRNLAYVEDRVLKTRERGVKYQWYDCNAKSIIPGATDSVYHPLDSGDFALIISNKHCTDTSVCLSIYPVGHEEISFREQFSWYPNPTEGKIHLVSKMGLQNWRVEIRNIHGQLVRELQFVGQDRVEVDIAAKPGIYMIQLMNDRGEKAYMKVVKK